MTKIGDMIIARPLMGGATGESEGELRKGTVVYVHPQGRYYTVEFSDERSGERFRESFYPEREPEPAAENPLKRPHFRTKKKYSGPLYR